MTSTNPTGRRSPWLGWPLALTSTLCFSIAVPISKYAIGVWGDATTMLVVRFVLSILLLGSTLSLAGGGRARLDRRALLICIFAGLTNGVGQLTFFNALGGMHASIAAMLFSICPLAVLGLLALRGERFTYRNTLRLALALSGLYLLIGPGGEVSWLSILMVGISIWGTAIHMALLQWYLQGYDPRAVTFYVTSAMMSVIVGYWLLRGSPWHDPGWQGWVAVGALALVSTFFARLGMVTAIKTIGSGQMAMLAPLETLLTVIWSILFLGEHLNLVQWLGGLLILVSTLLAIQRLSRVRAGARSLNLTSSPESVNEG